MTKNKHSRSISLTIDMHERLLALCDHLGTNPNSYMVNEIGKAVSRDEMIYKTQTKQSDFYSQITEMIQAQMDEGQQKP